MKVDSLPSTSWMPRPELVGGLTALISGLMMLSVNALTMLVKAAPMTTATARSITFPRRMKSLNPLIMSAECNGELGRPPTPRPPVSPARGAW